MLLCWYRRPRCFQGLVSNMSQFVLQSYCRYADRDCTSLKCWRLYSLVESLQMIMGSLSPNIGIPCAFKCLHHTRPDLPCSICVGYDYEGLDQKLWNRASQATYWHSDGLR